MRLNRQRKRLKSSKETLINSWPDSIFMWSDDFQLPFLRYDIYGETIDGCRIQIRNRNYEDKLAPASIFAVVVISRAKLS